MADKNFKVKTGLDLPAPLPATQGGTGQTSLSNAINALLPDQTNNTNKILGTNGSTLAWTNPGASYSDNAPSSPVVGQIWVESDSSSDSFDPNIIRRKTFTATAAQTVFTTDLEFIQGYEQVFFNGMLLIRNSDYTTASNTNVTLASGAAEGDIVEVVSITNLNSINTATTTTNTFTGIQNITNNLNVGTTIPAFANRLSIKQSADNSAVGLGFRIERNANDSSLFLGYRDNTDTWQVYASYNANGAFKPITFHTSDAERMRIMPNGKVTIGTSSIFTTTTSTTPKLTVISDSTASDVDTNAFISLRNKNYANSTTVVGGILSDTYRDIADPHYSAGMWFSREPYSGNASSGGVISFGTGVNVSSLALPTERMRIGADGVVNVSSGSLQIGGLPVGMVLVNSTTVSSSSAATFDAVFGATGYDNYLIQISGCSFSAANANLIMGLRLSGTGTVAFDNSTYQTQYVGTLVSSNSPDGYIGFGSSSYPGLVGAQVTLLNPLAATSTVGFVHGNSINSSGQPFRFTSTIYKYNSTSYFGFSLTPSSGTFSGTVRVYGLRNS